MPRIARGDKFENDTASAVSLTPPFDFAFGFPIFVSPSRFPLPAGSRYEARKGGGRGVEEWSGF